MNVAVKTFLEQNIDLIDNEQYDELYDRAKRSGSSSAWVSSLTEVLLDVGINPLEKMTTVPECFATRLPINTFDIPDNIVSIGEWAFDSCSKLTSITIGSGVTSLKGSVFYECSGLTSITIPNSVKSISSSVFIHCHNLKNVTFLGRMDEVEFIGKFPSKFPFQFITCSDGVIDLGR